MKPALFLLLAGFAWSTTNPTVLCPPHQGCISIYRDTYGVPHIYSKTDAGAAFGLMYAQAEDNFWQLEEDRIYILGRAAEIHGRSALAGDINARAWEVEKRAKAHYEHASPQLRALCDAFAAGVNHYLDTHPQVKPRLITRWEPWFILMDEHHGPAGAGITREERQRAFPVLQDAGPTSVDPAPDPDEGSNMWAISPSRTTTGHAMLLINPHVSFLGGGQRYEAHLHSGHGLDISGFAILGTPYIRSGHNRYLGWSHTNNYAQTADVYLDDLEGPGIASWSDTVRVKVGDRVETRTITFRKTRHGPVLGIRDGKALAVRAAGIDGGIFEQRWAMAKARDLREFQVALARRALTGSNTIYADVAGNIYYLHGNAIPKRSPSVDPTKPLDGNNPETEWQGLHELAELPQMLNPKSGYLQNCNSTPFLTTSGPDNPDRAKYPAYMAPEPDTPRAQRSRAILEGATKFSFADWTRLGLDTKIGIAAARVPEMLRGRGGKLDPLLDVLERWDQVGRNDSVATTLFVLTELRRRTVPDPMTALEQVKSQLETAWGTWQVPWGEMNRLQRVHTSGTLEPYSDARPSVPIPGAPSLTGTIMTFGAREIAGQKRMYGTVGDSYVAVVEFGKHPEARSLLVFGQSSDPAAPHFFDQADLYSRQQFKPAWFDLKEIKRHLDRGAGYRPARFAGAAGR
jgi:penicillin amidase